MIHNQQNNKKFKESHIRSNCNKNKNKRTACVNKTQKINNGGEEVTNIKQSEQQDKKNDQYTLRIWLYF
jgi:hypothetical protein